MKKWGEEELDTGPEVLQVSIRKGKSVNKNEHTLET